MGIEQNPARIETQRLILRSPGAADAVRIADLVNDYDVAAMTTRIPHPYGLGDAQGFVDRIGAADPACERTFLIEHRGFGPVGMVGFHPSPAAWSPTGGAAWPEIGYWLGRTFWNRGLASEAVGAALDWARRGWARRVVGSGHFIDNPASGRVLEKVGFLYTGEVQQRPSLARQAIAPTRMMIWMA